MSFFGKQYVLKSQENFDALIGSFPGLTDEQRNAITNYKSTLKVVKNGDSYTLSSTQPGDKVKETTFKLGVEFDDVLDKTPVKVTYTLDGDTLTQVNKAEDGTIITVKREFSGDECVSTITSTLSNIAAKRFYKTA